MQGGKGLWVQGEVQRDHRAGSVGGGGARGRARVVVEVGSCVAGRAPAEEDAAARVDVISPGRAPPPSQP